MARLASAAVAFHAQAGAAARNMRHDGRPAVQLGDGAQADGKGELDGLSPAQPEVAGLDEHAAGAKVARAAQAAVPAGQQQIDGGASAVAGRESSFHGTSVSCRCVYSLAGK